MPKRLESFYQNLNRNNMRRRLNSIYKWMVGRKAANKSDFVNWLTELGDWFEENA